MGAKTSQLQIRVSPDQKAALRKLAGAAGQSISTYVLSRALPSEEQELAGLMEQLGRAESDLQAVLTALATALSEMSPEGFAQRVPAPDAAASLGRLNRVAALVEAEAARKGVDPPAWAGELPVLERPHFWWALSSLKPHQLRVTPVAFKRRNVFFDPASGPAPALQARSTHAHALGHGMDGRLLARLDEELGARGVVGELYLVGGAILTQAFAAAPRTANVAAAFAPSSEVAAAVQAVSLGDGTPETWHHGVVRRVVQGNGATARRPFVQLPHVRVFEPLPQYVLALKCAAMRLEADSRLADDVRYLMRAMNLTTVPATLSIVGRYFSERQLPEDLETRIRPLLSG